jgi:hypothetical protein
MTWDRRLYFLPKEVVLPLKIHRPRPDLNPRTLGPVASTLPPDHRGRPNTAVVGSNPTGATDVCPRLCVVLSRVGREWSWDGPTPLSKYYEMSEIFTDSKVNSILEQARRLNS